MSDDSVGTWLAWVWHHPWTWPLFILLAVILQYIFRERDD